MGKIYLNQSSLRLKLVTGVDITGASVTQIKYKKPDGETTGTFTATVEDAGAGSIYYDFADDELDQAGNWLFWAFITFSDGRSAPGEPVRVTVYEEGY